MAPGRGVVSDEDFVAPGIPARGGVGSVGTLGVSESLRGPEMRRISVEDAQRSPKSILDSEGAQKGKFLCDAH